MVRPPDFLRYRVVLARGIFCLLRHNGARSERGRGVLIGRGCPLSLCPLDNIKTKGHFLFGTCQASTSRIADMSSSPTLRPDPTSIIGQLWGYLDRWERSVSLAEKIMLMGEFITTYSLTSDDSFRRERLIYSMWEASTQTSNLLGGLQARLSITLARMETLSQAGLEDRAEMQISILIRSGLRRHIADLLTSFFTFATSWLHEISSEDSPPFEPTATGNGTTGPWRTINPRELSMTRQRLRESMSGCHSLLLDLGNLARGESWPSPTSPWGASASLQRAPPPHGVGARGRAFRSMLGGFRGIMLISHHRRRSLILFGPYGCGKTTWARSLGSHIYFGSQWSGKVAFQGMEHAEYAIFDDWKGGLKMLPGYKDWLGAQWQVSVRQLHHDARLEEWGRPCIWLCNQDPRIISRVDDDVDWEWMARACIFVEVTGRLATFRANI